MEYRDAVISVADQNFVGIEDGLIGSNVLGEFLVTLDFGGQVRLIHCRVFTLAMSFRITRWRGDGEREERVSVRTFAAGAVRVGNQPTACSCWTRARRVR